MTTRPGRIVAGRSRLSVVLALLVLLIIVGGASAAADTGVEQDSPAPSAPEIGELIEGGSSSLENPLPTNPDAASTLPHDDLDRSEAIELLEGVFGSQLSDLNGIYNSLDVTRFLAPDVAVVPSGELTTSSSETPDETPSSQESEPPASGPDEDLGEQDWEGPTRSADEIPARLSNAALLDSSIPLRAETPSGELAPVDLNLEHAGNELQPSNPLVEVTVPEALGEGISLPASEIEIELAGAPADRSPSSLDSAAVFPNVAEDTDLVVAPMPTGVETLMQLRSPESPTSQTYNLDFPEDASLQTTEEGGAAVVRDGETLLAIARPTAMDAQGDPVPASLSVAAESLTVSVSPDESTALPILVDPLFQSYNWTTMNSWQSGICNNSIKPEAFNPCNNREEWGYEQVDHNAPPFHITIDNHKPGVSPGPTGIYIASGNSTQVGDHGTVLYSVPRYFKESPQPTSFIGHLTLSNLDWNANSSRPSPYLYAGINDPYKSNWVSYYYHEGLVEHGLHDLNFQYQFDNDTNPDPGIREPNTNAKIAAVKVLTTEVASGTSANVYVGNATVELGDKDSPAAPIPTVSTAWVNQSAPPIGFTASDTGLGVLSLTASTEQLGANGQPLYSWKASYGCIGVGDSACPRTWKSSEAGHPALTYEPAQLSTGISYLNLVAEDPVGNKSAASSVQVKVDHSAPEVTLSGSATEQGVLGVKRPSYLLKVGNVDGTTAKPQSGVIKTNIEFDGAVVAKKEESCADKNCAIPLEWTIDASKYSNGPHQVKVTVTDAVGLSTSKTLSIELEAARPALEVAGSLTEQQSLGVSRPRYKLKVNATAEAGIGLGPITAMLTETSSFGSTGAGNGQFARPSDIAVDSKGNLVVVDQNNNRIEQFSENGAFVRAFGSAGAGNGQFNRPTAVAVNLATNNIYVADAGNGRVQQFSEKGEFIRSFGSTGTGNGQFTATGPEGIAVAPQGTVWVSDTYNGRILQFSEKGEFLKTIGTKGTGSQQLGEPMGIEFGPGGKAWIADCSNNKVVEYTESAQFIREFSSAGAVGQLKCPSTIGIDSRGGVWVDDQKNGRILEFNQAGDYISWGAGSLPTGYSLGIAADNKGQALWVTKTNADRVSRWTLPYEVSSYQSSFGSTGTGNGQFSHPADIALSPSGSLYVVDEKNDRIEQFSSEAKFIKAFGSSGTGNGQFTRPTAVAVGGGRVFVTDAGGTPNRVVVFTESGEFLWTIGSTGTGNGQFSGSGPEGIAVDPKGYVWVADSAAGRIELFSEKGAFQKTVGVKGTGWGQLSKPTAIDIGPDGHAWITDCANNKVVEMGEAGEVLGQFGSVGTGNGQFSCPDGIAVDNRGDISVVDQGNNRVQVFYRRGETYLNQFGSYGAGSGQFNFKTTSELGAGTPLGIETNDQGVLWVADSQNNRVQRWGLPTSKSEIKTEVTVDGKVVDTGSASCAMDYCPLTDEWTLSSPAYTAGPHTVVVKAIDGLGNTTTKTLPIEVQRDTAKPTLQLTGGLVSAPEGWVEQETYNFDATAADAGYGVTSLKLKIDGVQVALASGTCADGGCNLSLSKPLDMSAYAGGAHTAEVIATDGALNTATKKWTINVDPEGHISTEEAEDTLEAVEETSTANPIGPSAEEMEINGTTTGLGVEQMAGEVVTTGTAVPTTIASAPAQGVEMKILPDGTFSGPCEEESTSPEEEAEDIPEPEESGGGESICADPGLSEGELFKLEPITVSPVATASNAGSNTVVNGVAAVAPNTSVHVDTITRPLYEGALTFKAIRDGTAPTAYSWEVDLALGQELKLLDSQHAVVYYEGGHPAFSITAEPAHDAVGTSVPTTLSVSEGRVITLNVQHHTGNVVYPVLSGVGWQGGFVTTLIEGPKDEKELREERERIEREEREAREAEEAAAGEGTPIVTAIQRTDKFDMVMLKAEGPPVPGATASGPAGPYEWMTWAKMFNVHVCYYESPPLELPEPKRLQLINEAITECKMHFGWRRLEAKLSVHGWFRGNPAYRIVWIAKGNLHCDKWGYSVPAMVDCEKRPNHPVHAGDGSIQVLGDYRFWPGDGPAYVQPWGGAGTSACVTVRGRIGYGEGVNSEEPIVRPARQGDPCPWP